MDIGAALGFGESKLAIIANCDTWLKRFPMDSRNLPDSEKKLFPKGSRLAIHSHRKEDNHYQFLALDIRQYLGQGYVFVDHVDLIDPDAVPTIPEYINIAQLAAIAPYTPVVPKLVPLIEPLNETMARYEINTPLRIAHFIAQIAHESDGFHTTREYADGSDYEWRDDLGNNQAGDGVRYRGRGLVQVTGRANYKECSEALGYDFVADPQALESFEYATLSAGWFWDSRDLNELADADDVRMITRIINGFYNGLEDRMNYLARAKQVFNA